MRQGTIVKSADVQAGDLEKINAYTRRELRAEEVYVFNVLLCDNDVDRDGESFTVPALQKLAELFLGKTGIFDHNPKGENQTARIFDTEVRYDTTRQTTYGAPYAYLKAKAYMVRSPKNEDLILEIDAGIKKEVSVGCSVGRRTCSVCGADGHERTCEHQIGQWYEDTLCYVMLEEPTDAYEWSFVAVPSQRQAGVTKGFCSKRMRIAGKEERNLLNRNYEELKKALAGESGGMALSGKEQALLAGRLAELEEQAALGKAYLTGLQERVVKLAFLCGNEIPSDTVASVAKKMSLDELKAFERAYEQKLSLEEPAGGWCGAQLAARKMDSGTVKNDSFKI